MNRNPHLTLVYHMTFAFTCMLYAYLSEGFRNEMFGYYLFANAIYLVFGFVIDYFAYLGLRKVLLLKPKALFLIYLFAIILVMNGFSYATNGSLITVRMFKDLATNSFRDGAIALPVHICVCKSSA
jgi:hypothetical protein